MNLEQKILLYWIALTGGLWIATVLHYAFTNSNYTWKYFTEDYSYAGVLYKVSLQIGLIVIAGYFLVKITMWWFSQY
jgi:hypothetical protein